MVVWDAVCRRESTPGTFYYCGAHSIGAVPGGRMFEIISICKGGGYMYCRTRPLHPRANSNGLYPLHRVVAENKIGRLLEDGEVVHHVDNNRQNNDTSNLEVMDHDEHSRLHATGSSSVEVECPVCEKIFIIKERHYRSRVKKNKNGISCSRGCGYKLGHMNRLKK